MAEADSTSGVTGAPMIGDIRALDAAYKPFPAFREWATAKVDTTRWNRYSATLEQRSKVPPEQLERAQKIAVRAAAVDTGAIEGLYETDRGFTFTAATEAATWQALLQQKGETARSLIESQIHAYDYVLDFATRAEPFSEAAIRSLHEQIVAAQKTYRVLTAVGWQEQPLPKGQYKASPNHVLRRDGKTHSYAPVDQTPEEMHRLVNELGSEPFLSAHPVLQASYAHYALVAVHPFADGNGRVARALASVFTYRAQSIPFLILVDQRNSYFAALEAADRGDFQHFVDFALNRCLEAMQLVQESLLAGAAPLAHESLEGLANLYITKGGYTQEQVDEAASRLHEAVFQELLERSKDLGSSFAFSNVGNMGGLMPSRGSNYRSPSSNVNGIQLVLTSKAPAIAGVTRVLQLEVPRDCGREDDLVLYNPHNPRSDEVFTSRVDEVRPSISSALQMRIKMFVEGFLSRALSELRQAAENAYRR